MTEGPEADCLRPFCLLGYNHAMPARDFYHDAVRNALIKDGWTITNDPLHLKWGKRDMYVDLGAEQVLAAEKGEQKLPPRLKVFSVPRK